MESPPSFSGWSEAPISVSEDSGLPLTSGSVSSGSVCGERAACELAESDGEDKSLSQYDSLDYSDGGMCGEHFNTLKKGPHILPIEPPPEFQDSPPSPQQYGFALPYRRSPYWLDHFATRVSHTAVEEALSNYNIPKDHRHNRFNHLRLWPQDIIAYSPVHSLSTHTRPVSRSSLGSSRLSSSHNSLSVPTANKADDSSFITQAMSHDALTGEISDMYNVPFDSDIYAVPVDMIRPVYATRTPLRALSDNRMPVKPKRQPRGHRKRRRNTSTSSQCELERNVCDKNSSQYKHLKNKSDSQCKSQNCLDASNGKRHSVPSTSGIATEMSQEPLHMTLEEVRNYLHTLYSSSSDSSDNKNKLETITPKKHLNLECKKTVNNNNKYSLDDDGLEIVCKNQGSNCTNTKKIKKTFVINIKNKKIKDLSSTEITKDIAKNDITKPNDKLKKSPAKNFSLNIKQTLCNIFRFRKIQSPDHLLRKQNVHLNFKSTIENNKDINTNNVVMSDSTEPVNLMNFDKKKADLCKRALPPLPKSIGEDKASPPSSPEPLPPEDTSMDFALSIGKVKDYGWYWGPISGEAAERILSNEPDGSFIVRDSSDHHYIFSLTFKLNGCVRHVRIEHDQGNFSFGSCTKFKSHTIVEFIENAVEHSRSGRYLFFLHRRPVLGPMRVQLLHPVSRFKQVQSLQHMCRFVILKVVRRDLIPSLPLPRRVIDYLSTKHYYAEQLSDGDGSAEGSACEGLVNKTQEIETEHINGRTEQDDDIVPVTNRDNRVRSVTHRTLRTERSNRRPVQEVDENTDRSERDRHQFHVIERDNEDVFYEDDEDSRRSVMRRNNTNEIEGIRRGGRFPLGLRNEREGRFSNREPFREWEESNSS